MATRNDVPNFFVYGEPSRSLDVGFLHVETVMERKNLHFGHVSPHKHPLMGQITYWFQGGGTYRIEDETWNFSAPAVSFVPSNVVHGFDVDEQSDAIVVSVSDDMLKAIVPQIALNLDVPTFLTGQPADPVWTKLATLLDMAFLFNSDATRGAIFKEAFARELPDLEFVGQGQPVDPDKVRYLLTWTVPGDIARYRNLEVLFCIGAGVDQLKQDSLPDHEGPAALTDPGAAPRAGTDGLTQDGHP